MSLPEASSFSQCDLYDVIVVGSGAAGLTAACVAAAERQSVLLLEHTGSVGGSTAISGGMVWIPANHKMAAAGLGDSIEAARRYLHGTVPAAAHDRRLEAFLTYSDEAVRYLEARTSLRLRSVKTYPDYYPDLPGATTGGRVLEPEPFDGRALGRWFALLREPLPEFTLFGGMMVSREDIPHLRRVGRSVRSFAHVAKLLMRYAMQRLWAPRGTTLYLGNALVARLLKSAVDLGVEIRLDTSVSKLLMDNGQVVGVEVSASGMRSHLNANKAVILATGGLSHDVALRAHYVPPQAGSLSAAVKSGALSNGASLAFDVGGRLSSVAESAAFWVPSSTFTRRDGSLGVFPHTVTDRGKPGLIAVNANGQRFVNEALSYHEFVRAQLQNENTAIPAFLICDRSFLWKYGLGRVKPFSLSVATEIKRGYLKQASTLAGLSLVLSISTKGLIATVDAFNRSARRGEDPEFGRGGDVYQRHLGDSENEPNPCVATIETGPFYAVAVYPSDLGMSAGIVTDEKGRVLSRDGAIIAGLYACGNDMQSVMAGSYPGPGITLGPALTFGYLSGQHASARCARPIR